MNSIVMSPTIVLKEQNFIIVQISTIMQCPFEYNIFDI